MPYFYHVLIYLLLSVSIWSSSYAASGNKVIFPDNGDWREISVDATQYPVVYIPALGKKEGALIIIQGKEERRFERDIIAYLRTQLPEHDWSTLGLNIPSAKLPKVLIAPEEQLSQSILLLKSEGHNKIYVLLYGEDAAKLLGHFIQQRVRDIQGVILLSAYAAERDDYDTLVKNIKSWRLYVYDIDAQFDYDFVKSDIKLRKKIFEETPGFYRQFSLPGASNDYVDPREVLMKWIRGWMLRHANLRPVVKP